MSKYVRTTDGIVESNQTVRRSKVVKYGETIEKLCDRIVIHRTDIIFLSEGHSKYRFEEESEYLHKVTDVEISLGVYAAIWTDKGLIYVAKMNEKGEFELL